MAIGAAFSVDAPDAWSNASKPSRNTAVDLQGGTYRVNSTLWLGKGLTFRLCCGGLVASDTFPDADFMIAGGGGLEGVTIHDVAIDMMRKGKGGLWFDSTLRVHLDRLFIHHYTSFGIKVDQGHEVHVNRCWIGEWGWSENPHSGPASNLTGVAIEVDGQDHWLSDIIIFSGLRGIVLKGGASVLTNTHIYNGGNESALEISGHSVRVLGSYFDFNRVVIIDPVAVDVSHSFFLGGVGIELRSSAHGAPVDGLTLIANQFIIGVVEEHSQGTPLPTKFLTVTLNESAGAFADPRSTVIRDSSTPRATYGAFVNQSFHPRHTIAQQSLMQTCATAPCRWEIDFSDHLVFGRIESVDYTFEVAVGFPTVAVRPRDTETPLLVVLETKEMISGTVTVTARQGIGSAALLKSDDNSGVVDALPPLRTDRWAHDELAARGSARADAGTAAARLSPTRTVTAQRVLVAPRSVSTTGRQPAAPLRPGNRSTEPPKIPVPLYEGPLKLIPHFPVRSFPLRDSLY
jgi:hypothetical protein